MDLAKGRSNPAVHWGSNTADSRHRDQRGGDRDTSLLAIKSTHVETLLAILRAKGRHSREAAHMVSRSLRDSSPQVYESHWARSCPTVGRKDGTCFESEAIISALIWCICSETDFSNQWLFHITCMWLLCYFIGFTIRQPIRTSSYSSELSSWNVRCNTELCPSGTFILYLYFYWDCRLHHSVIFKGNPRMTSFP